MLEVSLIQKPLSLVPYDVPANYKSTTRQTKVGPLSLKISASTPLLKSYLMEIILLLIISKNLL